MIALLLVAAPALAQSSGEGFLFKPPSGAIDVRFGFDRATAGSDIFSFLTDELTLSRSSFSSGNLTADVAFSVTPRIKMLVSAAFSSSTSSSQFRHFIDNNDQPIEQTTTFRRVPISVSAKMYLIDPGRTVGRFAWIPSRVAPYVGAGGGMMWYRFAQDGDFVDVSTLRVFPDHFESSGWTPMVQAFGGGDYSLTPRFALTGEGRYVWARPRLSSDFSGFGPIDLSGISVTGGIAIRY